MKRKFSRDRQKPLPEKLRGITNIVLLVDTTLQDSLENYLMPDIPIFGELFHHNDYRVRYENSSLFFFDNFFNIASYIPLTITLQFKLGLEDNGTSMTNLLLLANLISKFGTVFFKIYIFKLVAYQMPSPFNMPPINYMKRLKCIGFRFDTDYISADKEYSKISYYHHIIHHLPLSLGFLGRNLKELHLGQKVRLPPLFIYLRFPRLTKLGVECYDIITMHNLRYFLLEHKNMLQKLILRDTEFKWFSYLPLLKEVILLGDSTFSHLSIQNFKSVNELHWYGLFQIYPDDFGMRRERRKRLARFYFSLSPVGATKCLSDEEREEIVDFFISLGIKIVQVPYVPSHAWSWKWNLFQIKVNRRYKRCVLRLIC